MFLVFVSSLPSTLPPPCDRCSDPDSCGCGTCGSWGSCTFTCVPKPPVRTQCTRTDRPAVPPAPPDPCGTDTPDALVGINLAGMHEEYNYPGAIGAYDALSNLTDCASLVDAVKHDVPSLFIAFSMTALYGYVPAVDTRYETGTPEGLMATLCATPAATVVGMSMSWGTWPFPGSNDYVADICRSTCAAYGVYSTRYECSPCGQLTCSLQTSPSPALPPPLSPPPAPVPPASSPPPPLRSPSPPTSPVSSGASSSLPPRPSLIEVVAIVTGGVGFPLILLFLGWRAYRRRRRTPVCGFELHSDDSARTRQGGSDGVGTSQREAPLPAQQLQPPEIPSADISLSKLIGQGGMGKVYQGLWRGTPVAIKVLKKKQHACGHDQEQQLPREMRVLASLRHPCICSCTPLGSRTRAALGARRAITTGARPPTRLCSLRDEPRASRQPCGASPRARHGVSRVRPVRAPAQEDGAPRRCRPAEHRA